MKYLSRVKQEGVALANKKGHGGLFVLSFPERLLTTPYALTKRSELIENWVSHEGDVDIYLHLPFCEQKCSFCNFAVSTKNNRQYHQKYVETLLRQVRWFRENYQGKVRSVDIGGGTPLLLETDLLEMVSQEVQLLLDGNSEKVRDPTIFSFEQTSKLASQTPEKMRAITQGVKHPVRTSMGIQTIDNDLLDRLKRSGTVLDQPVKNCRDNLPEGSHISADLIFPLSSLKTWELTIDYTVNEGFDTITAYDLIENYGGGARSFDQVPRFSNLEYRDYYDFWYQKMWQNGYLVRYGSNNAIKRTTLLRYLEAQTTGTETPPIKLRCQEELLDEASKWAVSRYYHHRITEGKQFLGFGVGTSSRLGGSIPDQDCWVFNSSTTDVWLKMAQNSGYKPEGFNVYQFPIEIWQTKDIRHWLANTGQIDLERFYLKYGQRLEELYPREIDFVLKNGIMDWTVNKSDRVTRHRLPQRLSLQEGQYHWMPYLRMLFTPDWYLEQILKMENSPDYLKDLRKSRREYDRKMMEAI